MPVATSAPVVQPKPAPPKPALQPVEKPTEASDETPPDVAAAIMRLVRPKASDVVVDLGCGTGQLLEAALPYGCQLVGIELDATRVAIASKRSPQANIVHGDMLHQTYTDGTVFLVYLFDDLIGEVVDLLPTGSLIVSIEHPVPGVVTVMHTVTVDGTKHAVHIGVIS